MHQVESIIFSLYQVIIRPTIIKDRKILIFKVFFSKIICFHAQLAQRILNEFYLQWHPAGRWDVRAGPRNWKTETERWPRSRPLLSYRSQGLATYCQHESAQQSSDHVA